MYKFITININKGLIPINIDRVEYHYGKPNPKAYMEILSYFRPDNMLCVLSDSGQETPL